LAVSQCVSEVGFFEILLSYGQTQCEVQEQSRLMWRESE